jgi:hypothetical protein
MPYAHAGAAYDTRRELIAAQVRDWVAQYGIMDAVGIFASRTDEQLARELAEANWYVGEQSDHGGGDATRAEILDALAACRADVTTNPIP